MYSSQLNRQSMSFGTPASPSSSSSFIPPMSPTSSGPSSSACNYPFSPPPTTGFGLHSLSPPTSPFGMSMGAGHGSSAAAAYVASIQSPASTGSTLPRHSLPPQPSLLGNSTYHNHMHGHGHGYGHHATHSPLPSASYGHNHNDSSSYYQSRIYGSFSSPLSPNRSFGRRSDEYEPMNVSPPAGQGHIGNSQSTSQGVQYLPSYLTGESSPIKPSTPVKPPILSDSKLGYVSDLFGISHSPRKNNQLFQSDNMNEDKHVVQRKEGPPVSGLGAGDDNNLDFLISGSSSQVSPENASKLTNTGHGNRGVNVTSPNSSGVGVPKEIPMKFSSNSTNSPIQSGWVTVFGFPHSALSTITSQFSLYGTILESKTNPGSNWVHLKYSNKIEARRALNKNGTVIAGSIMVGVLPCDEALAVAGRPPGSNVYCTPSASAILHGGSSGKAKRNSMYQFPASAGGPSFSTKENVDPSNVKTGMRSMTLQPGKNLATTTISATQLPHENSGLISKAMEYLFGW